MSKFKKIIKEFYIKEQEEIEPIGGPTLSPNEFAYFDFKSWAYEVGTRELFREKKYMTSNGIEYTLEEATEMGAGPLFDVLTQIWTLWTEETDNDQFGRIKDENSQEFGKALYNMMKKDGKGFFFKGDEMGAKVGDDAEYLKQTYGVEMNESNERIKQLLKEAAPLIGALARIGTMARGAATTARAAATRTANAAKRGAKSISKFNKKYGDYIDAADAVNDIRKDIQQQAKQDKEDEEMMDLD